MKQYENGYTGKILKVNLSTGKVSHLSTDAYADRFVGGRGIAAKIYWDSVSPNVRALDPENLLIFVTGPLAGIAGFSGSRWQVCTKSPATDPQHFSYSNMGGHWGSQLKFAGYDGLVVEGAAEKPVYLVIRDDSVEIKDASHLWQKGAIEVREQIKSELGRDVRVVATGPAGDNCVTFANVLADDDASGSSAAGPVMGSKKLKAIAVRGTGRMRAADPEKVKEVIEYVRRLKQRPPGTFERIAPKGGRLKREACFGCIGQCTSRVAYTAENGEQGKWMCQSSRFYGVRAARFYGKQTETSFFANKLCDNYGVDTLAIEAMIMWIVRGLSAGILTEENTGLPMAKVGSLDFIEALVKKIAYRDGFGDVLAQGLSKAAETMGGRAPELITDYTLRAGQPSTYGPRMYITTGLFYAMEHRQPIMQLHEVSRLVLKWVDWHKGEEGAYMSSDLIRRIAKRFWGSEIAADFSTYEGKAMAAKMIQDRQYAKESLILCDFAWPIADVDCSEDHFGDPTVESRVYSAVTGREIDEAGLYKVGERVFNLQRAVLAREGHLGRESDKLREVFFTNPLRAEYENADCLAPGKDGEPLKKTGWVVDREKFEEMKTEYYQLRGWDPTTGLQTTAKLRDLGLEDIAKELAGSPALV